LSGLEDALKLPGAIKSFMPIMLPIFLISIASVIKFFQLENNMFNFLLFIGNPMVALLIGVLISLSLMPKFDEEHLNGWIGSGVKQAGPILLITGAGGAFGSVLKATPLTDLIKTIVTTNEISGVVFILLAFAIAAALKSSQGSSTASLVITSSLLAPLLPALGLITPLQLAFVVMAIGGGAMTISHANDSYFWVVTQFSGLKINDAYRSYTIVTLLQGVTVLLTTIILFTIFT
jgi:GntP family gluconate:H+ symporter